MRGTPPPVTCCISRNEMGGRSDRRRNRIAHRVWTLASCSTAEGLIRKCFVSRHDHWAKRGSTRRQAALLPTNHLRNRFFGHGGEGCGLRSLSLRDSGARLYLCYVQSLTPTNSGVKHSVEEAFGRQHSASLFLRVPTTGATRSLLSNMATQRQRSSDWPKGQGGSDCARCAQSLLLDASTLKAVSRSSPIAQGVAR